jgi:hypothetical protein
MEQSSAIRSAFWALLAGGVCQADMNVGYLEFRLLGETGDGQKPRTKRLES